MSTRFTRTLDVVNALIGFSKADRGWPSPLFDLGYSLYAMERGVGGCKPDVMFGDRRRNHAFLVELKLGNNIQENQHAAYLALTSDDLKRAGYASGDWASFSFDGAYVSTDDYADRLGIGLNNHGEYPLIAFSDDLAILVRGRIGDDELRILLEGGISLEGCDLPRGYMPFDAESSDFEVLADLLPRILARIRNGDTSVLLDDLLAPTFEVWGCIDPSHRRTIADRAAAALRRVSGKFTAFFSFDSGRQPYRLELLADAIRAPAAEYNAMIGNWGSAVSEALAPMAAQQIAGQLAMPTPGDAQDAK